MISRKLYFSAFESDFEHYRICWRVTLFLRVSWCKEIKLQKWNLVQNVLVLSFWKLFSENIWQNLVELILFSCGFPAGWLIFKVRCIVFDILDYGALFRQKLITFMYTNFNFFFLQYNRLQLDKSKNKWKTFYKEITKKETRKYSTSTYLTALSNRTVKKGGRGWTPEGKNEYIYLKLKK